jgi:hypothetical protein
MVVLLTANALCAQELTSMLRVAAFESRLNFEKISSWHGEYDVYDSFPGVINDKEATISRQSVLKFTFDRLEDTVLMDFAENPKKSKAFQDGKFFVPDHASPMRIKVLRTATEQTKMLDYDVNANPANPEDPNHVTGIATRFAAKSPLSLGEKANTADELIDPREFFYCGNMVVWDFLNLWADALEGKYGPKEQENAKKCCVVKKDDSILREFELVSSSPDGSFVMNVSVSLLKGERYLPVLVKTLDVNATLVELRKHKWSFDQKHEVFLPTSLEMSMGTSDGRKILDRTMKVRKYSINNKRVSTEKGNELGLRRGDRLQDKVKGDILVYDGRSLRKTETVDQNALSFKGVLFGFGSVCICVVCYVIWVRRKKE